MICLENTHNRCSGGVLTPEDTRAVCDVAHAAGVPVHLDGARIFNAAIALEVPAAELTRDVDDLSFCLSKSLSCPVGSVLVGSQDFHRPGQTLAQNAGRRDATGGSPGRCRVGRPRHHD